MAFKNLIYYLVIAAFNAAVFYFILHISLDENNALTDCLVLFSISFGLFMTVVNIALGIIKPIAKK